MVQGFPGSRPYFGAQLTFLPLVLSDGRINLELEALVSATATEEKLAADIRWARPGAGRFRNPDRVPHATPQLGASGWPQR